MFVNNVLLVYEVSVIKVNYIFSTLKNLRGKYLENHTKKKINLFLNLCHYSFGKKINRLVPILSVQFIFYFIFFRYISAFKK